MASLDYDDKQVKEQGEFEALPEGTYLAKITKEEVKPLKSGKGKGISFTWQVLEGPYKGRTIFQHLNLWHTGSDQTRSIAQQELKSITVAAGKVSIRDTAEIHGIPMIIGVKCVKDEKSGVMRNAIRSWKKRGSGSVPPPQQQQQTQQEQQEAGNDAAPWLS